MLTEPFLVPFPWSSVWDYNEFRSRSRPTHEGIDFGPNRGVRGGDSIRAANRGRVVFAGWGGDWYGSAGFGNLVVLDHGTVDGDLLWTLYAHMRTRPAVRTGAEVAIDEYLGPVGETGNARGDHLHWETWVNERPINPRTFIDRYNSILAAYSGGTSGSTNKSEEDEDMRNSGVYYNLDDNTVVYLIFNAGSGWYHEFSNGEGNGSMPSDYNNALAGALYTPSWAKVTRSHADVIKQSLEAVQRTRIDGKLAIVES